MKQISFKRAVLDHSLHISWNIFMKESNYIYGMTLRLLLFWKIKILAWNVMQWCTVAWIRSLFKCSCMANVHVLWSRSADSAECLVTRILYKIHCIIHFISSRKSQHSFKLLLSDIWPTSRILKPVMVQFSKGYMHDDVIKSKHCPRYLPFVRGIYRPPVNSPSQRPVTRNFDIFFDLCLNKRWNKQPRRRWFETPSRPL